MRYSQLIALQHHLGQLADNHPDPDRFQPVLNDLKEILADYPLDLITNPVPTLDIEMQNRVFFTNPTGLKALLGLWEQDGDVPCATAWMAEVKKDLSKGYPHSNDLRLPLKLIDVQIKITSGWGKSPNIKGMEPARSRRPPVRPLRRWPGKHRICPARKSLCIRRARLPLSVQCLQPMRH